MKPTKRTVAEIITDAIIAKLELASVRGESRGTDRRMPPEIS